MCMAKYKPNLSARLKNHSIGLINMFLVLCTHYVTKYLEEKNPQWSFEQWAKILTDPRDAGKIETDQKAYAG